MWPFAAILVVIAVCGCANATRQTAVQTTQSATTAPTAFPLALQATTAPASTGQALSALDFGAGLGSPTAFTRVLDIRSMVVGIYRIQAGATDSQDLPARDEGYVVLEGSGILYTPDFDGPVAQGSIAFVRAGVPHHFIQVDNDLTVVVLIANPPSSADEPQVVTADANTLAENPSPTANLFRRFLKVPSITGGAYLLPIRRGGDRSQTHQVDELNVVISGTVSRSVQKMKPTCQEV